MDGEEWHKDRKSAEELLKVLGKCSAATAKTLSDEELKRIRELLGAALVVVAQELASRGK